MIKVTVEIISGGQVERARTIGTLNIGLQGVRPGDVGQYSSTMSTDGKYLPPNPTIIIDQHPRDQGAFALIQKCLDAHLQPPWYASVLGESWKIAELPPEVEEYAGETCGSCDNTKDLMGCQYDYGHPNHYDGVSEWRCPCGARTGRWTGKVLAEGESERPFGR